MITHPWSVIRRDLALTQLEIARALNVDRQTVIRLEQGLFHSPSSEVLEKLSGIYETDPQELLNDYWDYVTRTRQEFMEKYPDFAAVLSDPYTHKEHPLVLYREVNSLTRMGLCKGLCLDYAPVADFEYNRQRSIPESLLKACREIGWDCTVLEKAVADWRILGHADK
jgi:transcriptional regulator with XRE-family HTH domain